MSLTIQASPVPLRLDDSGTIRVADTRISLERLVEEFEQGASPEDITRSYDSLRLADVYAVIAYYLQHRDEVDHYLVQRRVEAEALQRQIEASQPPRSSAVEERISAHRARMEKDRAAPGV